MGILSFKGWQNLEFFYINYFKFQRVANLELNRYFKFQRVANLELNRYFKFQRVAKSPIVKKNIQTWTSQFWFNHTYYFYAPELAIILILLRGICPNLSFKKMSVA
jgi:hypothetical protein